MILIQTVREFRQRAAILFDYEFESVGLAPDTLYGAFDPHRIVELMEFCRKNPDYHIVSLLHAALYFNRVMPNATGFYLGQGDSDPRLACFERHEVARFAANGYRKAESDFP